MIPRIQRNIRTAILLVGIALLAYFVGVKNIDLLGPVSNSIKKEFTNANSGAESPVPSSTVLPSAPIKKIGAIQRLNTAISDLESTTSAYDSRKILCDLHAFLSSLSADLAVVVISDSLVDSANDANTRIDFAIGAHGLLSAPQSLRGALLDRFGQIAPKQAGMVANLVVPRRPQGRRRIRIRQTPPDRDPPPSCEFSQCL